MRKYALFIALTALTLLGARAPAQAGIHNPVSATGTAQVVTNFVCDGTDQTTAITALLNAGGNLYFGGTTCQTQAIAVSGVTLTIDFSSTTTLQPVAGTDIDALWTFTNSDVEVRKMRIDGLHLAAKGLKFVNGTMLSPISNITLVNFGWTDAVTTITDGVVGLYFSGTTAVKLHRVNTGSGFTSIGDGTFVTANLLNSIRGLYFINTGYVDVDYWFWQGGTVTGDNGVQIDAFHATTGTTGGIIRNVVVRYNQNLRRVVKIQSGNWVIGNMDVRKASDFTPFSGGTNVGLYNFNAIDWAAGTDGTFDIKGGYIDCSGFPACIGGSLGTARVQASNVTMQLNILDATRDATVCNGALVSSYPKGFYTSATNTGSGISNSTLINGGIVINLLAPYTYARNNRLIDPYREAAEISGGTARDGIDFSDNTVRTQTPGYMASSIVTVFNASSVLVSGNKLSEEGNTTHAATFINASNASATGLSYLNVAPAATTAFAVGSSAIVNLIDGNGNINSPGTLATGTATITSTSINALTVGANGATNPALQVSANASSAATGFDIISAAAGSSVTLQATSSATDESLIIANKGASKTLTLRTNGANRLQLGDEKFVFTPAASTGASTVRFSISCFGDTSLTTLTEAPCFYLNMGQTRTHATGNIPLQRDARITATTHAAGGASIITDGAGLAIDGGPLAGSNITFTTDSALYMPTWSATGATTGIGVNVAAPTGATTNYALKTTGKSLINGEISGGTTFTVSGCSASAPVGGAAAGQFTSGTTGVCTATVTINGATGMTAPNGWSCWSNDETTGNLFRQTASNTATATFSGTTVTSDVITFGCMGY